MFQVIQAPCEQLPAYEEPPKQAAVDADLGNGHRYVDAPEHKLTDYGVNVVSNNILLPEGGAEAANQTAFPYFDGIQDSIKVCGRGKRT